MIQHWEEAGQSDSAWLSSPKVSCSQKNIHKFGPAGGCLFILKVRLNIKDRAFVIRDYAFINLTIERCSFMSAFLATKSFQSLLLSRIWIESRM